MPPEATKQGVRTTYTEPQVQSYIKHLIALRYSLRKIAREVYHGEITHSVVQKARDGKFPSDPHKRYVLHLPALEPTPVCVDCGEVHTRKTCPNTPKRKKPQPFRPCLPKVTDEQRAKILAMTPEERLRRLLNG